MTAYRYELDSDVCLESVEIALLLASWGTESLHGTAAARLDAAYLLERARKLLLVDSETVVGETFNRLLCGFLEREVGADAFRVRRVRRRCQANHDTSASPSDRYEPRHNQRPPHRHGPELHGL